MKNLFLFLPFFFICIQIFGIQDTETQKISKLSIFGDKKKNQKLINPRQFFIKNYSTETYSNQPQNWAIAQDKRGVIYIANHGGILEYDGKTWRTITIPNLSALSMIIDYNDTIYIGGKNEIGYLKSNSSGNIFYISLISHLYENQRKNIAVWSTHCTTQGVYYNSNRYLFRWNPKQKTMKIWKPIHQFFNSFECKNELLIFEEKTGLMKIQNDNLHMLKGSEELNDKVILYIVPYSVFSQKILIGTLRNGLYLYDGIKAQHFPSQVESLTKGQKPYYCMRLKSSNFALATRKGGLYIFDSKGFVKHIINKNSGLQNENIKCIFEDNSGNLWLGLENGISKIEYNSPFSFYNEKSGLNGTVFSVIKKKQNLYIGTSYGLIRFSPSNRFKNVPSISSTCFSLLLVNDIIFAATSDGIWMVQDNKKSKKIANNNIFNIAYYALHQSKRDTSRIWVGGKNGLTSIYPKKKESRSEWHIEHEFKSISEPIRTIAEDKDGNLWLGTLANGVLKVKFQSSNIYNPLVSRYNTSHSLPASEVNVFFAAGHIMFATNKGLYRFDKENQIFIPNNILGTKFSNGSRGVFRIIEDCNRNIWLHSNKRNILAKLQSNGSYKLSTTPFFRMPKVQTNFIYPDPNQHLTWFACVDGLYCYDSQIPKDYNQTFHALIRKVQLMNNKIIIYNGYRAKNLSRKTINHTLEYKNKDLHFEFAAPFFEAESKTQFQFKLVGYDKQWSDWTSKPEKEYTNLDFGSFTFKVRAKNVYDTMSTEDTFNFGILPPWYRTWWAYLLYILIFIILFYLTVRWRSQKLVNEKLKLERIVKERTKEIEERTVEIEEKNIQLESQTNQLKEQSEKLKEMDQIKSRFFANISHEFRTPLTLIMGPLEQMIANCKTSESLKKRKLTLMLRNAQRLLRLINQLLELSKLDSGKMKLNAEKIKIIPFLKGITDSFQVLTHQKEIELTLQIDENIDKSKSNNLSLFVDTRRMEDIMTNLLANAFKFTPPGGKVTVGVKNPNTSLEKFPGGHLEITVADTGPGISEDQLNHIFDRFFQAGTSYEFLEKGSGIGLALCKELVELHNGIITAQSQEGKGSVFIIRLPKGDKHLKPEEIIRNNTNSIETEFSSEESWNNLNDIQYTSKDENENTNAQEKFDISTTEKINNSDVLTQKSNIILVVEDSPDMREYIKDSLEPEFNIALAKDGQEGINKALELIPDLIISDIMMPNKDGYQLCQELKNNRETSHIPIILLTAKASEESILQGLEIKADDYITKPFNTRILIARIKNLIDLRSQLQKNYNRQMTLQPVKSSISPIDQKFLNELQTVINKNLPDPDFNVEQLCKKLFMGRTTIYRKILALSGLSPTEFIRSYRLKKSTELLKQEKKTILKIALEVGFANPSYFAKCFKEKFHMLPSEYQAMHN